MTRDDIIRMAREAYGVGPWWLPKTETEWLMLERLMRSASAAGAGAEREACAKVCDEFAARDKLSNYYAVAANAIRARGQA